MKTAIHQRSIATLAILLLLPTGKSGNLSDTSTKKVNVINKQAKKTMASFLLLLMFSSYVSAQSTTECVANVRQGTRVSSGTLNGTVAGAGVGAVGCAVFLALVPFDLGLSYATCVGASAGVGGMVGNRNAHSATEDEIAKCAKLGV